VAEVAEEVEPVAEAEEVWSTPEFVPEEEEEDEDDERRRARDKKQKQRVLEFDERLGRVVARKKRKPSRRGAWDADEEGWS